MPISNARAQVLSARGQFNNSRDFLSSLLTLLNTDWSYLERMEREEIIANGVKMLRLLT